MTSLVTYCNSTFKGSSLLKVNEFFFFLVPVRCPEFEGSAMSALKEK